VSSAAALARLLAAALVLALAAPAGSQDEPAPAAEGARRGRPAAGGAEGAEEAEADAPPPPPEFEHVRAAVTAEPDRVEVGEPMRWTLTMAYPDTLEPRIPERNLGAGTAWEVLEFHGVRRGVAPDDEHTRVLEASWTVCGFEPTRTGMPRVLIPIAMAGEEPAGDEAAGEDLPRYTVDGGPLVVSGVLGRHESAPRPSKGFREPAGAEDDGVPTAVWVAAGGTAVALGALALAVLRRRRRTSVAVPVAPLERLAELEEFASDDLAALQSLHYALSELVRETTDERLGVARPGLTDREWLDALAREGSVDRAPLERLDAVLSACEGVKYARQKPSSFAVAETLGAARAVLEACEGGTLRAGAPDPAVEAASR